MNPFIIRNIFLLCSRTLQQKKAKGNQRQPLENVQVN